MATPTGTTFKYKPRWSVVEMYVHSSLYIHDFNYPSPCYAPLKLEHLARPIHAVISSKLSIATSTYPSYVIELFQSRSRAFESPYWHYLPAQSFHCNLASFGTGEWAVRRRPCSLAINRRVRQHDKKGWGLRLGGRRGLRVRFRGGKGGANKTRK